MQTVRGSARRTRRTLGGAYAIGMPLIILGLWLFAKDSFERKLAGTIAIVLVAGVILLGACVTACFTVAEVRDRRLNFYCCGIRTRSILLTDATCYELSRIGRLSILCIRFDGLRYVPNGALNQSEVVELLRAHGVAERRSD